MAEGPPQVVHMDDDVEGVYECGADDEGRVLGKAVKG